MKLSKERAISATVLLTLGFLATSLLADPPSSPAPGEKPATSPASGDPFVKKDAPAPDETGPVSNLILTFEKYQLSQTEGAKLIQESEADQDRYDRVRDLVKTGHAWLKTLLCVAARPGQQGLAEQVDILRYAINFQVIPGKGVYASDYKQRNLGDRVVFKISASPDQQSCNAIIFMESTRLKGFVNQSLHYDTVPFVAAHPDFTTQRVNNGPAYFTYGKIRFLGTYSPVPLISLPPQAPGVKPGDSEMTLVFGRASQLQLTPVVMKDGKPSRLECEISLYSMDRSQAREILVRKQEPDSAYQDVQALVKAGQAKLEHMAILRTDNGIKSNLDEMAEITYPTGSNGGTETQDVGFSQELKPDLIGESSLLTIDLTKSQLLNDTGRLQMTGISMPYNESQPLFELQSLATQINSGLGEHELVGTISPAEDTGVNDQLNTGRVWLEFIRTTAVNP